MRGWKASALLGILAGALIGALAAVGVSARADLDQFSSTFRATDIDMVALGAGYGPDYIGAGEGGVMPAAFAHFGLGEGRFVELVGTALTTNFFADPHWQIGPALNYRLGRRDAGDPAVKAVHEVDDAWEVGLSLGWRVQDPANSRNSFRVGLDVLQDVSSAHGGFVADLTAVYRQEVMGRLDLGILAGVTYASGDYMDEYFGVSANDSVASGLAQFSANGGIRDLRLMPLAVLHFDEHWQLGASAGWQRLIGDAADSPIVRDRGDENQFFASMTMAYTW